MGRDARNTSSAFVRRRFHSCNYYYNDGLDLLDKAEIIEWLIERIREKAFTP